MGSDNIKATPNIYALCYRHADFAQTVEEQMQAVFAPAAKVMIESKYKEYVDEIKDAAVMNAIRWNYYNTTDTAAIADNYNSEINFIYDFIKTRTDFLSGALTLKNEGLTISHIPSQKRTGSEITPEITVKCLDRVLTEGVDYTAAFSDNVERVRLPLLSPAWATTRVWRLGLRSRYSSFPIRSTGQAARAKSAQRRA